MTITEIIETPNKELEKIKILTRRWIYMLKVYQSFYQIIETVQLLYFVAVVEVVKLKY